MLEVTIAIAVILLILVLSVNAIGSRSDPDNWGDDN